MKRSSNKNEKYKLKMQVKWLIKIAELGFSYNMYLLFPCVSFNYLITGIMWKLVLVIQTISHIWMWTLLIPQRSSYTNTYIHTKRNFFTVLLGIFFYIEQRKMFFKKLFTYYLRYPLLLILLHQSEREQWIYCEKNNVPNI